MTRFRVLCLAAPAVRLGVLVICGALVSALALSNPGAATAQQTAPSSPPDRQPATEQATPPAPAQQTASAAETPSTTPPAAAPAEVQPAQAPDKAPASTPKAAPQTPEFATSEDQLRKMLVGKPLFLRGGYLDNNLTFNEHGMLIGHSPQGSYTLSALQIERVHLTKHKVELEGSRYALHFLGALPYEDPTKAVDRVNVTPKKKIVRITIDRELVVKPKQEKGKNKSGKEAKSATPPANSAASAAPAGSNTPAALTPPAPAASAPPTEQTAAAAPPPSSAPSTSAAPAPPAEETDADEAKAEMAAAPPEEQPADPKSVTTTLSPAHANKVLEDALVNIFAQPFDTRMMASMPGFWKLYYQAAAEKTDYHPKDPTVLSQSAVDKKARLLSIVDPPSNQFAQDYGVAGMCLYHVVIDVDGKPGEIAVARPIGFGLDESAVDSIRKAKFEPAFKDGKPVPVMLDLVVEFRIYSKRTAAATGPETAAKPTQPVLPGPYSVQH